MNLLYLSLFFVGAFIITYFIIPKIIKVVKYKRLLDEPNGRSSHKTVTPTLGGVAFFCTIIISLFFLKKWDVDTIGINLTTSLTILFIVGLKDDLVAISAITKTLAQILAITFLLTNGSVAVDSLNGFLSINTLNNTFSIIFSGFCLLYIINSYNLIDGIDGLASSIGITILSIYGTVFFVLQNEFYFLLCAVLVGLLMAFLVYNFSDSNKIFMGDTGSMIIGFMIGFLSLKLSNVDPDSFQNSFGVIPENLPILISSILCIPFLDTIRVFLIRTLNKKSFFIADTNHIHHIFLKMGYTHKRITFIMVLINIFFIGIMFVLSKYLSSFFLFIAFIFISLVFCLILFYFNVIKEEKNSGNNIGKSNFLNKLASSILNLF